MATMKDVAKRAEVSTSTVSHVINNTRYVSPELKQRVKQAMEELEYSPHAVARSLRADKTQTVGVIVSDITNPFFAKVVRGIESVADNKDYKVIVTNTDEKPEKEVQHLECLVQEERIDGLIIAPTGKNRKEFEKISDDIPITFVDRAIPNIKANAVLSDNVKGAYEATNYLIKKGHKRIGIVLGLKDVLSSEERFEGYRKALTESHIRITEELTARGDFKLESARRATKELLTLEEPPTSIFTVNNKTTYGALKAIKHSQFNWPEEIELAGFDDLNFLELLNLPITTVQQNPTKMGVKAAELLLRKIKDKNLTSKTIRVGVNLSIRENPCGNKIC